MQICFALEETDLFMSSKLTSANFFRDLAVVLLIGKVLPILAAATVEARSRAAFLKKRCDAACPHKIHPCVGLPLLLLPLR
jgi:hypothetical protein